MRVVVKFDGGYDSRRLDVRDNEINMLLCNAVGVAAPPIAFGAGDNVRKTHLARNQIAIPHDHCKDTEKCGLVSGQQETARLENASV